MTETCGNSFSSLDSLYSVGLIPLKLGLEKEPFWGWMGDCMLIIYCGLEIWCVDGKKSLCHFVTD